MAGSPERIGKYRVLEPVGRGGMGSVYKAHDPVLDRLVAIKVMTEGADVGTEARERFLREAQSAARLNHPNIITVYELGEDQGQVFIVMEMLEGEPLSRVIARVPPLGLRARLALMTQVCDGLAFAHQRGIVHRDIKPANIFVLASGQVKILDFGIARLGSSDLTRTGLLMGTPNYMSPEQARGRRTDARSDIFSVGVVFYELLSGRKPFVGEDYFETMEKVRAEDPPALGEVVPDLPPALVRAVHRTLAKDPSARYQNLEELRGDLAALPEMLAPETTAAHLREAVDRKFAEVARLHRSLVATIGATALGEETLPLAAPAAAGTGLETILRDLESQTERLRALARTVERLEPTVARAVAAFDRGAFEDAMAALQPVLQEVPQHQRARDYYERARLELLREHTVRSFAPGTARPEGSPARPAGLDLPPRMGSPAPEPARAAEGATAVATPPPFAVPESAPMAIPVGTVVTSATRAVAGGRRFAVVLAGVALVAVVGGGIFLFRPATPPRAAPAPVVEQPRPVSPPAAPPAAPATPAASSIPAVIAPAPKTPAATPKPKAPAPTGPAPTAPATGGGTATGAAPAKLSAEQLKTVEDAIALAQVFQDRGDPERALREYQRALAIDPKHAEARKGATEAQAALKGKR
jgi:tetratricopeptide (TPR) repeat protein